MHKTSKDPTPDEDNLAKKLFQQLVAGHRAAIAQCITLVESMHHRKQAQARELLAEILGHLKKRAAENGGIPTSFRIGLYAFAVSLLKI